MCDYHSILECYVVFSGVKLSIRSFNLFHLMVYFNISFYGLFIPFPVS